MKDEESATTVGMAQIVVEHLDGVGADDFAQAEEVFELEAAQARHLTGFQVGDDALAVEVQRQFGFPARGGGFRRGRQFRQDVFRQLKGQRGHDGKITVERGFSIILLALFTSPATDMNSCPA